jgi:hypothetical protein
MAKVAPPHGRASAFEDLAMHSVDIPDSQKRHNERLGHVRQGTTKKVY